MSNPLTLTQAELDEVIERRLAKERRRHATATQALRDENTQLRAEVQQLRDARARSIGARLRRLLRGNT